MEDKLWKQQVGADARGADVTAWLRREDDASINLGRGSRPGVGAHSLTQWPRRRWSPREHRLQYCTEGLGSESSSDVLDLTHMFCAQPETSSRQSSGPVVVSRLSTTTTTTMRAREFPPPLTSLLSPITPSSVVLKSKRQNGRLLLVETRAPSFSSPLTAHRQHGRLRLLHLLPTSSCPGVFASTSSGASAKSSVGTPVAIRSSGNHATFGGGGGNSATKEEEGMITRSNKNIASQAHVISTAAATTTATSLVAKEEPPPPPNGTSCGSEHFVPPLYCPCSSWCSCSGSSSNSTGAPHCFLATAS